LQPPAPTFTDLSPTQRIQEVRIALGQFLAQREQPMLLAKKNQPKKFELVGRGDQVVTD
jgi:hypothetical protein